MIILRVQKYGNEGSKSSFSKMALNTGRKICNCFSMEVVANVTTKTSYVHKHFYLRNMLDFFNYSLVI